MAAKIFKYLNVNKIKKAAEGLGSVYGTVKDFTGAGIGDAAAYIGESRNRKKEVRLENFAHEIEAFAGASVEEQKGAVVRGVIRAFPELVGSSPVDTGEYAASWDLTPTETSIILGNYSPHAPIIEKGARPFTPPIGPLLAWAKRVLKDSSQPPNYSSEVWGLAIGTQKKIAKHGMEPKHVLENMIPVILGYIVEELKRGR